jgi:hypothetical protein
MKFLLVTALAFQIASVGYAENKYWRYRDTLLSPTRPNPSRFHLPPNRTEKMERLDRISEGGPKGIFKKYSESLIKNFTKVCVFVIFHPRNHLPVDC